jgi:hypothetical protein
MAGFGICKPWGFATAVSVSYTSNQKVSQMKVRYLNEIDILHNYQLLIE